MLDTCSMESSEEEEHSMGSICWSIVDSRERSRMNMVVLLSPSSIGDCVTDFGLPDRARAGGLPTTKLRFLGAGVLESLGDDGFVVVGTGLVVLGTGLVVLGGGSFTLLDGDGFALVDDLALVDGADLALLEEAGLALSATAGFTPLDVAGLTPIAIGFTSLASGRTSHLTSALASGFDSSLTSSMFIMTSIGVSTEKLPSRDFTSDLLSDTASDPTSDTVSDNASGFASDTISFFASDTISFFASDTISFFASDTTSDPTACSRRLSLDCPS